MYYEFNINFIFEKKEQSEKNIKLYRNEILFLIIKVV